MTRERENIIGSTVLLVHPWTREEYEAPIDSVISHFLIVVRWEGQGGPATLYDVDLRSGEMQAASKSAKRRVSKKQHWIVKDLPGLRKRVRIHIDGVDKGEETREAMVRHEASMPGVGERGKALPMSVVSRILGRG